MYCRTCYTPGNGIKLKTVDTMGLEKKLTGEWVDFNGDYEKTIQDIKLQDGRTIRRCYPNAGVFICIGTDCKTDTPYKDVKRVRKCLEAYAFKFKQ